MSKVCDRRFQFECNVEECRALALKQVYKCNFLWNFLTPQQIFFRRVQQNLPSIIVFQYHTSQSAQNESQIPASSGSYILISGNNNKFANEIIFNVHTPSSLSAGNGKKEGNPWEDYACVCVRVCMNSRRPQISECIRTMKQLHNDTNESWGQADTRGSFTLLRRRTYASRDVQIQRVP